MSVFPDRVVACADALSWLEATRPPPAASVVTSLPDVSELAGASLEEWKGWFMDAAGRVMNWVPQPGVAIFYQSDIRVNGVWIDKSYLVQRAAETTQSVLLWHKIVCRHPAGLPSLGRASYSHLLCFARGERPSLRCATPDVLPNAGASTWTRGMGLGACRLACQFLLDETTSRHVVDPFCGQGMVLAVANSLGLSATGVDRSNKRCRVARKLRVEGEELVAERSATGPSP